MLQSLVFYHYLCYISLNIDKRLIVLLKNLGNYNLQKKLQIWGKFSRKSPLTFNLYAIDKWLAVVFLALNKNHSTANN